MEGERGKSVTAITAIAGVGASGAVAVAIVVTSSGTGLGSGRLKVWRCSSRGRDAVETGAKFPAVPRAERCWRARLVRDWRSS